MKKFVAVFLVLCAAAFFYSRMNAKKPVLMIGMECDYAPNNWEEKRPSDSNLPIENHSGFYAEGYDLQIAKYVAQELGYDLKVKKIAWNSLINALQRKEIDAIFSGMLDTNERRKKIAFSDTYEISRTEYAVVVNKATKFADAKTLQELYGIRMAGQKGTNLDSCIDQIPGVIHETPTETVSDMLELLVTGKIDGIVINYDTGQSYCRTYDNLALIRFPEGEGFVVGFNGICAGVRKQDRKLLADINKVLDGLSLRDRKRIMDRTNSRVWENL